MPKKRTYVNKKLSVVIPVYGRFDLLEKCVDALYASEVDFDYEVILVDNNSPEKDYELYDRLKQCPNLTIIMNNQNLGFPRACNQGANKRKSSPYIFFLNSDVILQKDALQKLMDDIEKPDVGVVGMKLLFPTEHEGLIEHFRPSGMVQHVGVFLSLEAAPRHIFVGWPEDSKKVNKVREVQAVTGAALMTKRSLFRQAGGFDENYGLGTWEDVDYCITVTLKGKKKVVVNTDAVGTHYTSASAETYKIPYPLQRNQMYFMQKFEGAVVWSEWKDW